MPSSWRRWASNKQERPTDYRDCHRVVTGGTCALGCAGGAARQPLGGDSQYDIRRVRRGPLPKNFVVPLYYFASDSWVVIGESQAA